MGPDLSFSMRKGRADVSAHPNRVLVFFPPSEGIDRRTIGLPLSHGNDHRKLMRGDFGVLKGQGP